MLLRAAAIAAIAGLLLVALPSDQRRPYRPREDRRLRPPYQHEPREMYRIDSIARGYAFFGRDSIALTLVKSHAP